MTPHNLDLIFTLTGALVTALAFGLLTRRIGLSPILGYMVAGIFLGRHVAGFVANYDIASELAEIGVVLLMFGVGLQFDLKELLVVRDVAIPGALVQIALATALGAVTAHGFGWTWGSGILFGLSISVASTVVLTRILSENNALHTQTGHIAIGWLVVEDIFTVLVLVLVPVLAGQGGLRADNALLSIGGAIGKIALLIAITFFVGRRWLPEFLGWVAATRSRELFTLAVLAVALGIAVSSATLFGASLALGAFLAGMVVNQSAYSHRAAIEALPMRDAFAVLFFVSVGMLFNPLNFIKVAGLAKTKNLILTASELSGAVELIQAARDVNPKVYIVARTTRLGTKKSLLAAGADRVFSAEGEMALSITECLLQTLGATRDQLEANRDSIRKKVLSFES
jgi:monovalent cation:H+ antiporter-2, CPA2 family